MALLKISSLLSLMLPATEPLVAPLPSCKVAGRDRRLAAERVRRGKDQEAGAENIQRAAAADHAAVHLGVALLKINRLLSVMLPAAESEPFAVPLPSCRVPAEMVVPPL